MNPPDASPHIPDPVPVPGEITPPKNQKSSQRGLFEDMLVTAFGMATSAVVAYGSYYGGQHDFAVYTWMWNWIVPIGAILCGFVAAVGYWIGSRVFHHRPTRLLLLNIVLVSVGAYFSIHHLDYSNARGPGGQKLEDVMTFPDYMIAVTEHMSYKSSRGRDDDEPTQLGKWGWGVAALQILGFSLGGFGVYGMLVSVPYCDRCSRYFAKLWSRVVRWKDLAEMGQAYESTAELLKGGQLQPAVDRFVTFADQTKFRVAGMVTMELRKCPTCEKRRLKLTAQRRNGNQYVAIGEVVVPTEEAVRPPG